MLVTKSCVILELCDFIKDMTRDYYKHTANQMEAIARY